MYSRFLYLLVSAGLSFILCSCSLTTNDPPEAPRGLSLKSLDGGGCLGDASDTLADLFDGRASEEQVVDFWDCLGKSFRTFADNTKGRNENEYTGGELAKFLETYFLKGKVIQPEFLGQAMLLKRAILGGSANTVSREEIYQTLELIKVFKEESLRLRPYFPISVKGPHFTDPSRLEEAMAVVVSAADHIGEVLAQRAQGYFFDDFDKLLSALDVFLSQKTTRVDATDWIKTTRKYLDVVKWAKSVLIVPPETNIAKQDWKKVFQIVPRYYSLFMRFDHAWNSADTFFARGKLSQIRQLVIDLHVLLGLSLNYHEGNVITFTDFDNLITALGNEKLDILPVKANVMKDFVRTLVKKILRPENTAYSDNVAGLKHTNLNRLLTEFEVWVEGQFYLDGLYNQVGGAGALTGDGILQSKLLEVPSEDGKQWTERKDALSLRAIDDIQKSLRELRPNYPNGLEYVVVPKRRGPYIFSYDNMTKANWLKRAALLLIDAYKTVPVPMPPKCDPRNPAYSPKDCTMPIDCSAEKLKGSAGLNKEQVVVLFADFFELLKAANLLSESGRDMAPKRFFEATLFLSSSNGNSCLETNEAIEILATLLSVADRAKVAWNEIYDSGLCGAIKNPGTGDIYVEKQCLLQTMYDKRAKYWSHIPGFVNYLDNFNKALPNTPPSSRPLPADVVEIFKSIYLLARDKDRDGLDEQHMTLGEFQGFMLMPYYVEMIFDRFDTDNDGNVSEKEGKKAFEDDFKNILITYMPLFGLGQTLKNAEAAYTYLLSYGAAPKGCKEKAEFYLVWRNTFNKKKYNADRLRIYKIFSLLLDKINNQDTTNGRKAPSDCQLFDWIMDIFKGKKSNMSDDQSVDASSKEFDDFMNGTPDWFPEYE